MLREGTVKYELFILISKSDVYEGKVIIEFQLTDTNISELFLDFQGLAISEMQVNDTFIPDQAIKFTQHKLQIPKYNLNSDSLNKVSLKF